MKCLRSRKCLMDRLLSRCLTVALKRIQTSTPTCRSPMTSMTLTSWLCVTAICSRRTSQRVSKGISSTKRVSSARVWAMMRPVVPPSWVPARLYTLLWLRAVLTLPLKLSKRCSHLTALYAPRCWVRWTTSNLRRQSANVTT